MKTLSHRYISICFWTGISADFDVRIITNVEYHAKKQSGIRTVQFSPDDKYIASEYIYSLIAIPMPTDLLRPLFQDMEFCRETCRCHVQKSLHNRLRPFLSKWPIPFVKLR